MIETTSTTIHPNHIFMIPFSCRGSFLSIHPAFNTMSHHLWYTATTITKITRGKSHSESQCLVWMFKCFINYSLTHTKISLSEKHKTFTDLCHAVNTCFGQIILPGLSAAVQKSEGSESDWRVGSARLTWEGSVCLHLLHPHVLAALPASALLLAGPDFCLHQRATLVSNRIQKTYIKPCLQKSWNYSFGQYNIDSGEKKDCNMST